MRAMIPTFFTCSPASLRALSALLVLLVLLIATTGTMAGLAHAPFRLYFADMPLMLKGICLLMAAMAALWDGFLLAMGRMANLLDRAHRRPLPEKPLVLWKARGFLSLGLWPWIILFVAAYGILMSSNITLLNLALNRQGITAWRDVFFWSYESGAIRALTQGHWGLRAMDVLYVACWIIQMIAFFALMVSTRSFPRMAMFCGSYLLTYFCGRWIGCLLPVYGPVFFQPELYGYLKGTLTQLQVDKVWMLIHHDTHARQSAVLLGGLSAMPSLHVAMVALCGWWIAARWRFLLIPVLLWIAATWYTTVGLGWHYISDGAGALVLAAAVIGVTKWYFALWKVEPLPARYDFLIKVTACTPSPLEGEGGAEGGG